MHSKSEDHIFIWEEILIRLVPAAFIVDKKKSIQEDDDMIMTDNGHNG